MATGAESLTAAQQLAIASEARPICVRAGPGSGKTRVLAERVIERVMDKKLALRRLLAITFTENAAAEMKERLATGFEKRDQEELRRQLESTCISTIHGFCARLLRENAIDAALDPRFQVLDEVQSGVEKAEVLERILEDWDRSRPDEFLEFVRHFKNPEYSELLLKLYDKVRALGSEPCDPQALLAEGPGPAEGLRDVLADVQGVLKNGRANPPEVFQDVERHLRRALAAANQGSELLEAWTAAREPIVARRTAEANRIRKALNELRPAVLDVLARPQRAAVARLLTTFDEAYTARKTALAALDFDDLERHALRMLSERPGVLQRLRSRFDEILVDEHQDTSETQDRIVRLLTNSEPGPRLFVVGDPAQSIYAFRGAEPAAFERHWAEATPPDGPIDLRDDFRSRPEIVAAVNVHFLSRFEGASVSFKRLTTGSRFRAKEVPSVEMLLVKRQDGEDLRAVRANEARLLANRIRELVRAGEPERRLLITNVKKEAKPLEYGDVAMLFRSGADIRLYERALDEAGIPYFSETGRGFYQAPEVCDVIGFLRVLDNPRNEIALTGVLRSPMFGVSDDAVLLLVDRARADRGLIADVLRHASVLPALPEQDSAAVPRFCAQWNRLFGEAPWRSLTELIRDIVATTGYETTLLLEPDGRRKVANLRKLADVAGELESSGASVTLRQLIAALDHFRFTEAREGEAQLDAESENAVRLMTMHRSKGLEFPLVVLPDLSRGQDPRKDFLDFLPGLGIGVQIDPGTVDEPEEIEKTARLEAIRAQLDGREEAENLRVLFVACSRAQEHLLLSGCVQPDRNGVLGAEGLLGELCASFRVDPAEAGSAWRQQEAGQGEDRFTLACRRADERMEEAGIADQPVARRYRADLESGGSLGLAVDAEIEREMERLKRDVEARLPEADRSDFIASATDIALWHACPRRYYLGRYLGYDSHLGTAFRSPDAGEEAITESHDAAGDDEPEVNRRDFGIAVHKFLAGQEGALEALPGSQQAEARRLAGAFHSSQYGQRTAQGDVRRELPVLAKLGDRFLRGDVDLLQFENGVPSLLLDYKTNKVDEAGVAALAEHYRPQMLVYARLVEAAFGARPREAVVFFLAPGVARTVDLTAEAAGEAEKLLEQFFGAQRTCTFPERPGEQCRRCNFNGTLCMAACDLRGTDSGAVPEQGCPSSL